MVAHTPLILGDRQTDLCEFMTTLGYTKLIQSKKETAHTKVNLAHRITHFNPSPREVEIGVTIAGLGGERSSEQSEKTVSLKQPEDRIAPLV